MAGNRNSGRRPQPTALKLLKGDPNLNRINEFEPKPPKGAVIKPAMAADVAAIWDRVAPVALEMGTLTSADVDAFKTLCQLQAAVDVADGSKLLALAQVIRPYYAMFGLEPSGRGRLKVAKREEPKSKWAGKLA